MPYRLQFVSSVSATPTVTLDLNNNAPWRTLDHEAGTDFTPPDLQRATAGTLLADGRIIPSAAYDNRVLTLVLQAQGALTEDAAATAFQAVARELNKNTNVLLYQPETTQPVFFRTFRASLSNVVWEPIQKTFTVQIPAEPFAVGVEVSYGSVTVNSHATGNIYTDLTGILGDVETPLKVVFPSSAGSFVASSQELFATRRSLQSISLSPVLATSGLTPSTDTSVVSSQMRTTFASSTALVARFSGPTTLGANRDTRGRYRVFAQVKHSVGADVITLQFNTNDAVTLVSTTVTTMVDLGYISIPGGNDPVMDGFSGSDAPLPGEITATIAAARVSGSGNLDVTYLIFIPADDQLTIVGRPSSPLGPDLRATWDGPRRSYYTVAVSTGKLASASASFAGTAQLNVTPGMTNRLFVLGNVAPGADIGGGPWLGGGTSEVLTLSCWPRYLLVRPATT